MTALVAGAAVGLVVLDLTRQHLPKQRHRGTRRMPRICSARGAGVAALAATAVLTPPAPLLLLLAWWTHRRVRTRRAQQLEVQCVRAALPDLVDLLVLASSAGLSLPVAHPIVARHTAPPVGPRLVAADEAAARGRPRADALIEALAPLGERARALADVLVDHLRYGVPLVPALERAGLELRLERRRAAELDARRVPVRLLGPLVSCVLPAFALLTVVPLLAASLDALPT